MTQSVCPVIRRWLPTAALLLAVAGCRPAPPPGAVVVVTTSFLDAVVRDLAGGTAGVRVVALQPPGVCPSHVDLSPRIVPEVRAARLLLRHDFQPAIEERLVAGGATSLRTVPVRIGGSLVSPDSYVEAARQVAAALVEAGLWSAADSPPAVERIAGRMKQLAAEGRTRAAAWQGRTVVASIQQKAFCEWLGLRVLAAILRPEDVGAGDLDQFLDSGASAVVGNLQSDAEVAVRLAARMGRPLAILSNFPGAEGYGASWDELFRANLARIEALWAQP